MPPPARYTLLVVYAYLFWLAGQRVNYALEHVENKFDVARTLGGALMCLTVPLATYQVRTVDDYTNRLVYVDDYTWWWWWWWFYDVTAVQMLGRVCNVVRTHFVSGFV